MKYMKKRRRKSLRYCKAVRFVITSFVFHFSGNNNFLYELMFKALAVD